MRLIEIFNHIQVTEREERALPSLPHKQKTGFPHASAYGLQHRPESAPRTPAGPSGGRSPFRFSACPPFSRSSPDGQGQDEACPAFHWKGKKGGRLKGADAAMVEARIEGVGLSLAEITERHMAAQKAAADVVREWDDRRAAGDVSSVAYASALLAVVTEEATARRIVMEYRPLDYQESINKLAYISAFLIAAEVRLEESEMAMVMEAAAPFG
ncbi:hypothetical protein [Mesorhizobium sp. M5C.F.Ca.IN.020.32.2.1]|uniref:hypothetical protein n=1 Tax=Mesorhizobium sp. M5C.F.Ca.IN.020.32.2.1 TaxID=2496771 RepID=UPI001FE12F61|nr:hypothetical protein [Mesorhizobium sp. M5C.F.Ca.IN.020.32.2.1]